MRPLLGPGLWDEFVAHANAERTEAWLRAFAPEAGVLRCVGTIDGAPCEHGAAVDLGGDGAGRAERAERAERGVERGSGAYAAAPRAWDDGLDGAALCHDLFGVCDSERHGAACVRFRCGPPRDASGARVQFVDHAYCHHA